MLWLALLLCAAPDAGVCSARSDCQLDADAGTCRFTTQRMDAEGGPLTTSGATCVCEAGQCQPLTVVPVACKSWKDCSWTTEPFLHPVPATSVPRPHKRLVRPCRDGERDSVCDEASKTCRVRIWKC